jgi:nucleoside-diphosphate-sugar epimerase
MSAAILGCGYVGKAVAQQWSQLPNFKVVVTTTTPDKVPQLEAIPAEVAIWKGSDVERLKSLLQNRETVLLSVAAKSAPYQEAYLQTAENLVGTLAEIPSIKQIIYTSSCGVYGDRSGDWVDERSPLFPATENTEILAQTERILLSATTERLKVCILRLGGIYGRDRELIKIFRHTAGTTRPGTGEEPTNWIHLDDIVGAIEFARQQHLSGIYNVVDGLHLTYRELLDRVMDKHQLPRVSWDALQPSQRSYNAKVSDRKLKNAGYSFIHPQLCDRDT